MLVFPLLISSLTTKTIEIEKLVSDGAIGFWFIWGCGRCGRGGHVEFTRKFWEGDALSFPIALCAQGGHGGYPPPPVVLVVWSDLPPDGGANRP